MRPRISLDVDGAEKNLTRFRKGLIRGILNQNPVTKKGRQEGTKWFGAPNYEGWQQEALASMGKKS